MTGLFLINVILALVWVGVSGSLSALNFVFGYILAAAALWVIREETAYRFYFIKIFRILKLILLFLKELVLSAFQTAKLILFYNKKDLQPGFIACNLNVQTDFEITLLANLITLTPGTLSVDVSDDKKTLYIHTIDVPDVDRLRTDIALGFEKQIRETFDDD